MSRRETAARAAVDAVIGKRSGPYLSWHPVNEPMIWQWVAAFGDRNPLYSDAEFARAAGHSAIVSPAAMTQGWCLPSMSRAYPTGSAPERPYAVLDILNEFGFTGNVAVGYDQRFLVPVTVGDTLHFFVEPIDVTDEKKTRLGTGHFITCLEEYRNQHDAIVYESRTTYFQFKAVEGSSAPQQDTGLDPAATLNVPEEYEAEIEWHDRGSTFTADADIGQLTVPITSSRIAVCALASRDWMPVHHSREAAIAQGQPDIFMNILTTGGFVGRFLTDWAGPGSTIRAVKFSLGVPNYPGDTMTLSGKVLETEVDGDPKLIRVGYEGRNSMGPHVTGQADVLRHSPSG